MNVVYIRTEKQVKKTKREIEQEENNNRNLSWVNRFKTVPLKEPVYIVEMSMEELQLVSFYLELEKRKPIINVELETKLEQRGIEVK